MTAENLTAMDHHYGLKFANEKARKNWRRLEEGHARYGYDKETIRSARLWGKLTQYFMYKGNSFEEAVRKSQMVMLESGINVQGAALRLLVEHWAYGPELIGLVNAQMGYECTEQLPNCSAREAD